MPSARTIATGFEIPRAFSSPEGGSVSFLSTSRARTHERKWAGARSSIVREALPPSAVAGARRDRGIEEGSGSQLYSDNSRSSKNCDYSLTDIGS